MRVVTKGRRGESVVLSVRRGAKSSRAGAGTYGRTSWVMGRCKAILVKGLTICPAWLCPAVHSHAAHRKRAGLCLSSESVALLFCHLFILGC